MKKKNLIIALALSTSVLLTTNLTAHANELTWEAIGIDQGEFDWESVPAVEAPVEDDDTDYRESERGNFKFVVENWDEDTEDEVVLNKERVDFVNKVELKDGDSFYNPNEDLYKKTVIFRDNDNNSVKLIQVFNPDLTVSWFNEAGEAVDAPKEALDGNVVWADEDEAKFEIKIESAEGIDKDGAPTGNGLVHDDTKFDENSLPIRNRTPKILVDDKEIQASNDQVLKLIGNIENGFAFDQDETTVLLNNNKWYQVSEYVKDPIKGTTIKLIPIKNEGNDWFDIGEDKSAPYLSWPSYERYEYEDVDFQISYDENPELEPGERRVVQYGVKGKKRITITVKDGVDTDRKEEITQVPINQIVEFGPAKKDDVITTETEIEKREIPFETEFEEDGQQPVGYRKVKQAGEQGYNIVRVTRTFVKGVEDKAKRFERVIATREPLKQIIVIGTKCKDEKKVSIPLTPATPIEKEVDCTLPLIPLVLAKPIDKTPERPIIDNTPIVDETTVVVEKEETVVTPVIEETQDPTIDIDKIIKEIEEGTKEITDIHIENEKNEKELDKEDKEKTDDKEEKVDKKKDDRKETSEEKTAKVLVKKEKQAKASKTPKSSNPKTGIIGTSTILATLAAAASGLFASKKRK